MTVHRVTRGVLMICMLAHAAAQGQAPQSAADGAVTPARQGHAAPPISDLAHGSPDDVPVCSLSRTEPNTLAVEPCRPAPPRAGRRAVAQSVATMPRPAPAAAARPGVAPPPLSASRANPVPLIGCDAGGCRDAAGARYNGGVGNAAIDRNGKLCTRHGAFLHCP